MVNLRSISCLLGLLLLMSSVSMGQRLKPAEAKERIKQATPTSLPQIPKVAKAQSDAKDQRLRGRVKNVVSGTEESTDKSVTLTSEEEFDNSGSLVSRISFDYQGNPWRVMVFGYIDNKRVAKDAVITYDYDPPPMAAAPGSRTSTVPVETRYSYSYEYVYDTGGNLTEKTLYSNSGQLISRDVFSASEVGTERKSFNRDGKLTSQAIEKFDSAGNLVESSYPASNGYGAGVSQYTYEKFDPKGNWTRRIVTGKSGQWGDGQKDFHRVEVRTITYHKS